MASAKPRRGDLSSKNIHQKLENLAKPIHQEFQVPEMEGFLNLIFGYFGGGVPPLHKPYPYSYRWVPPEGGPRIQL